MGVISRYVQRWAAIARLGKVERPVSADALRATVSVDAAGVRIGGDLLAWTDVRRLVAYKRDVYVGDSLCLAIVVGGDRVFEIDDASPGWKEAGEAIEQFLPGSMPRAEWMLRLIAAHPGQSMTIHPVA